VTAQQYQSHLKRLGLDRFDAKRLFGCDSRTAERWWYGETKVPPTVAILLKLLTSGKISLQDLA
jgi:DNA-binding transcriptional regulator YdaS (Cro superfamily)